MTRAIFVDAVEQQTEIDPADVISEINRGRIIILRGGQIANDILEHSRAVLIAEIGKACGKDKASEVRSKGLTKIHESLSIEKIEEIHEACTKLLTPYYLKKCEELIRLELNLSRFYLNHNFVLRFYVPNSIMKENMESLSRRPGKLVQHGPHHDYWQNVALNAVNIWMAIEDVDEGNGMVVYEKRFGRISPRGHDHIRDDQAAGRPVRLPCKAGDIILFHSQHPHGGVLNRTSETRVAVTTRFTVERPLHPRLGGRLNYASAAAIKSGSDFRKRLSYLSDRLRPVNLLMALESKIGRGRPGDEDERVTMFDSFLRRNWYPSKVSQPIESRPELSDPSIEIVGRGKIRVRREDGEHVVVSRRCPHMGADLACGYVSGNHLWCPWHDQGFSLETGAPVGECPGLPGLKIAKEHEDAVGS
jgi:nitrite reductase/ring-hydroxylating ferredoxin subunit